MRLSVLLVSSLPSSTPNFTGQSECERRAQPRRGRRQAPLPRAAAAKPKRGRASAVAWVESNRIDREGTGAGAGAAAGGSGTALLWVLAWGESRRQPGCAFSAPCPYGSNHLCCFPSQPRAMVPWGEWMLSAVLGTIIIVGGGRSSLLLRSGGVLLLWGSQSALGPVAAAAAASPACI